MSRITLRSQAVQLDQTKEALEAIVSDLQGMAMVVGQRSIIYLSGSDRIAIPTAGVAKIYAVSSLTTVGSDGSNYFVVTALRNGQDETGVTRDTRAAEITGYTEFYLGVVTAGKGNVITLQVSATGLIYPILTNANLSIRVELGPQATVK